MCKIIKNNKMILLVSLVLILCLIIVSDIFPVSALVYQNEDLYINSGSYYYIKNLQSGKYLDVEYASDSDGANVSQYIFTGAYNQQWRVVYNSADGYYKLYPRCSSTRCLDVYTANGYDRANIDIYEDSNNFSRKFAIKLNTDGFSYRILTASSNYYSAVTVSGASCDRGANVFQFTYTSGESKNDDWIFEPVTQNYAMGVNYAKEVATTRVVTYPDLSAMGDCTNFVSQCMLAGGVHMQNQWYIDKLHNNNPTPTQSNINDGWEYRLLNGVSPWISVETFCTYWDSYASHETITASSVINNPDESFSRPFTVGDVIICKDGSVAKHALYIVDYVNVGNGMTYVVASHTNDYCDRTLVQVAQSITSDYFNPVFEFYSM